MTMPGMGTNKPPKEPGSGFDPWLMIRLVPIALISIAVLFFWAQNRNDTRFDFLWFNFTARLGLMLTISFIAGAIFAKLVELWMRAKKGDRISRKIEKDLGTN